MAGIMNTVNRFESNLLKILHGLLGRSPVEQTLPLLLHGLPAPHCLSRVALDLIQDTLNKGITGRVARGGWSQETFMQGERPRRGRLWHRWPTQQLAMHFSPRSLQLLIWLTSAKVDEAEPPRNWNDKRPLSLGDRLLFLFAMQHLHNTTCGPSLCRLAPFRHDALFQLAFAAEYAETTTGEPPDFSPWLAPSGFAYLEALQSFLAQRWFETERDKSTIIRWQRLEAVGNHQTRILSAYLSALEAHGRRDLARFLLVSAGQLLAQPQLGQTWFSQLDVRGLRVADRMRVYRAGLAMLHQVLALEQWDRQARGISYLDEGYAASQLWKSDWERLSGQHLIEQAQTVIRDLAPLKL